MSLFSYSTFRLDTFPIHIPIMKVRGERMDQIRIGKFIAERRKEKGMTQAELADKIGVTDRAVSKWENGRGLPDYTYVKTLCEELGITFDEFISGEKASADTEETHQKNLEGVYKLFDKVRRKNNKYMVIAGVIGLVILLAGTAFAIDAVRMIHNRPVLFSDWGTGYVPSINLEKEKIDIAIRDYCLNEYDQYKNREGYTDEKTFVEIKTFKTEGKEKDYYAYTWVLLESFGIKDGEISVVSGYSIPHRFTVSRTENGEYEVIGSEIPRDGSYYESSLKELFPRDVLREMNEFEQNGSIHRMKMRIDEQRDRWFQERKDN